MTATNSYHPEISEMIREYNCKNKTYFRVERDKVRARLQTALSFAEDDLEFLKHILPCVEGDCGEGYTLLAIENRIEDITSRIAEIKGVLGK